MRPRTGFLMSMVSTDGNMIFHSIELDAIRWSAYSRRDRMILVKSGDELVIRKTGRRIDIEIRPATFFGRWISRLASLRKRPPQVEI